MTKPNVTSEGGSLKAEGTPTSVVLKFVEAINAGDPEELPLHQTEDFSFIDYRGNVERGRQGWSDYFSSYPEYKIHVHNVLTGGNGVAIIGKTTGSHVPPEVEEKWNILWTAEIRNHLVSQWRIYSDVDKVQKILRGETLQVLDQSPESVALKFVEVINAGDSDRLIKLQTEDFTLIDMEGDINRGRQGWPDYFSSYPEYKIHVHNVLTSGNGVAIIGKTTGSHVPPEVEEKETVLWTAEIQDSLVSEWRLYSDIEETK